MLEDLWKRRRRHERRPARRGDRHDAPRPTATRRAAPRRSTGSPTSTAPARRPRSRPTRRAHPAREPLREGLSALTPLLRPTRPSSASATPPCACATSCATPRELGAHLHIDMESFDSREAVTDLVLELLSEDEFRDGPSAGLVLQAYLRDSPELRDRIVAVGAQASRAASPPRAARQGRLLGPRDRRGAPARLGVAGLRGQGRLRPQLRGAHAPPARGAAGRPRRRSPRTTCARRPRHRGQPAHRRRRRRRRVPGPARPRRRPPAGARRRAACACAPTARSATSSPGWPTSCGGCSRTRATSPSCRAGRAAPLEELLAAP